MPSTVKHTILFVDDEKNILNSMKRLFHRENYNVLTADSVETAWQLLKKHKIHVIVTDHKMPKFSGLDLLKKAKLVYPDTIRIMLTGYADMDSVLAAVNEGAVYKFMTKPWNDEELKLAIRLALAQYNLRVENQKLKDDQHQQMKNIDKLSGFINKSRLGELLLNRKIIDKKELTKAKTAQLKTGKPMSQLLLENGFLKPHQLLGLIETHMGIEKIDLNTMTIPTKICRIIPKEICINNSLIPIEKKGNQLIVAMSDPTDQMKIKALSFMTGMKILPLVALQDDIFIKIEESYQESTADTSESAGAPQPPPESHDAILVTLTEEDISKDPALAFQNTPYPTAVEAVNLIIADALNQDASDVHIEAKSQYVMVRYRLNGLLFDKFHIPTALHSAIVSRIKIMAELDISEKRRPQDGRITVKTPTRMVDMRLSTLPTIFGEKIVFRILDRNSSIKEIDELGMSDFQVDLISRMIKKPQGCILVTGPTGSGKTSTLYSLIQKTATIHKNYTTVEDPVEYFMENAEQVMIKEKIGLTFPVVLRTLLRQDPDTIMLGEIRDFETAEVAFHAALTGHTVLSTLHTNSCIATITRLLDMGIQSHIIGSALNGIIAQRLVRRICPHCMVDDDPNTETANLLGVESEQLKTAKRGQGCEKCDNTGYHGRTGIYEILNIGPEIERLLQQGSNETAIGKAAQLSGMVTLFDSGFEKIQQGITTCDEVLRVLGPRNINSTQCPNCKRPLTRNFHFCPFCAFELKRLCSECNQPLEPEWKACPECGNKIH